MINVFLKLLPFLYIVLNSIHIPLLNFLRDVFLAETDLYAYEIIMSIKKTSSARIIPRNLRHLLKHNVLIKDRTF